MSWKATAFVKEITEGITQSEKLVLMVLSDYHHTTHKAAWPSIPVLARESLMTERTIYRVLASLEGTRLRRISIPGKPNAYQFIGLDTPDIKSGPQKLPPDTTPDRTPDTTPDKFDTAIRKEPVLEPVLERGGAGPRPQFSQNDFDERDLRKVAEGWKVLEDAMKASVGGGYSWTERQAIEFVCERAGITVERFLELQKKQKQWPLDWDKATAATA